MVALGSGLTLPNNAVAGRLDSEKSFWGMKVGSLILMSSR